jgi:hypothetical protein
MLNIFVMLVIIWQFVYERIPKDRREICAFVLIIVIVPNELYTIHIIKALPCRYSCIGIGHW